jgi:hypothetical protein
MQRLFKSKTRIIFYRLIRVFCFIEKVKLLSFIFLKKSFLSVLTNNNELNLFVIFANIILKNILNEIRSFK